MSDGLSERRAAAKEVRKAAVASDDTAGVAAEAAALERPKRLNAVHG